MSVFHQYDIRGIYGSEINEDFAYNLGKVILKYTKAKRIIIGYDSRIGNLKLFSAISKAIIEHGVNVVHAGIVSRPMLNWISWKHKYDLGIMITASHNPKEYNGFKFIWNAKPLNY
ncbi:MAG: phosphomannomutase/phosphoglucomutase, partial [Candidatus Woesearchaeota archaeon]